MSRAKTASAKTPKAPAKGAAAPSKGRLRTVGGGAATKAAPAKVAVAVKEAKGTESRPNGKVRRVASAPAPGKPSNAEGLKARFAELSSATSRISGLKRSMNKNFFDVGIILNRIRDERLYEVKGYGSFESFVERELDLNKVVCLRSARIAEAMIRDVALEAGLERSSAAVAALDGEAAPASITSLSGPSGAVLPFHKQ